MGVAATSRRSLVVLHGHASLCAAAVSDAAGRSNQQRVPLLFDGRGATIRDRRAHDVRDVESSSRCDL